MSAFALRWGYHCDSSSIAAEWIKEALKRNGTARFDLLHRLWDDKYFWMNGDASHRIGGLFGFAMESRGEIHLPASVRRVALNENIPGFLTEWDLFIVPDRTWIAIQSLFDKKVCCQSISLIKESDLWPTTRGSVGEIKIDILAIRTENILSREVSSVVRRSPVCFDLSAYVRCAFMRQKETIFSIKVPGGARTYADGAGST